MLVGYTKTTNLLGKDKIDDFTLEQNAINENILLIGNISYGGQELVYSLINELLLEKQKIIVIIGYIPPISYWENCIKRIKSNNTYQYKMQILVNEKEKINTDLTAIDYNSDVIFVSPQLNGRSLNDKNIVVDDTYIKSLEKLQQRCPDHVIIFSQMPIEYIPENISKCIVYSSSYKALNPDFQKKFKTKIYMNLSASGWIPGFCSELEPDEAYISTNEQKKINTNYIQRDTNIHYIQRDINIKNEDCLSFSLLSNLESD